MLQVTYRIYEWCFEASIYRRSKLSIMNGQGIANCSGPVGTEIKQYFAPFWSIPNRIEANVFQRHFVVPQSSTRIYKKQLKTYTIIRLLKRSVKVKDGVTFSVWLHDRHADGSLGVDPFEALGEAPVPRHVVQDQKLFGVGHVCCHYFAFTWRTSDSWS